MISGNKRSHVVSELYSGRIETAQWFYRNSTIPFDVYGKPPFELPNYRGIIPDGEKLSVLKQYRFSLCFENTNHPVLSAGYITEKILDCFETRTIPIYLGACNIEKYIPEDCFIDYRKFSTLFDLESYLKTMSDKEYQRLISAIDQWIAEGNFQKYTNQPFFNAIAQLCAEASGKSLGALFNGEKNWREGEAVSSTANEWHFLSSPQLWTWNELARAEAPLVKNGELVRKPCKTAVLKSGTKSRIADMAMGQVSIIISATMGANAVKKCLNSIQQHSRELSEIILLIHKSSPDTTKEIKKTTKRIKNFKLIEIESNPGLSTLINQAVSASTGEYILLLDPNVIVTRNWLSGMLDCLKSAAEAGVVGPLSNFSKGPQRAPASKFVSGRKIDDFALELMTQNHHRRIPCNDISGFCMLFTHKLFQDIGGFDERFGLEGGEDRDFCIRSTMAGKINFIAGDVYVHQQKTESSHRSNKSLKNKWRAPDQETLSGKEMAALTTIESGIEAYQKDELDNAVECLLEAIRHLPSNPTAYFELAGILLQSHNYTDALNVIKELPSGANEIRKNEILGYASLGLNLDQDALKCAKHAISINHKSAPGYNLLGLLALKQGNREKAASFFKQALIADPGYGEPYVNLGGMFLEDAPDRALNNIERGFILSPHIPDILSAYYAIIADMEEYERAEPVFESAVSAYPLNKILRYRFIDVLFRQGKLEQALKQIEESMVLFGLEEGMLAAALKIREMAGPREISKAKKTKKTALSICMIAKDEEAFLAKCLHSVTHPSPMK